MADSGLRNQKLLPGRGLIICSGIGNATPQWRAVDTGRHCSAAVQYPLARIRTILPHGHLVGVSNRVSNPGSNPGSSTLEYRANHIPNAAANLVAMLARMLLPGISSAANVKTPFNFPRY